MEGLSSARTCGVVCVREENSIAARAARDGDGRSLTRVWASGSLFLKRDKVTGGFLSGSGGLEVLGVGYHGRILLPKKVDERRGLVVEAMDQDS